MRERVRGFTLIEVLLVVTLIGIVASIALPALTRARGAASEVSVIASLRAIHSAQAAFHTTCGGGYYAPSIPWLARRPTSGGAPFISPDFSADTTDRQGYRVRFSLGSRGAKAPKACNGLAAGQAATTYFVGADLLVATGGLVSRYFGINQAGTVYQSTKRIAPFYSGKPPSPAKPIQ